MCKFFISSILTVLCISFVSLSPAQESEADTQEQEEATGNDQVADVFSEERQQLLRLQIFLDNADFNPGKLDGHWGTFTGDALTAWLRAQDREEEIPQAWPPKGPENLADLADLESVEPTAVYTVKEEDQEMIGNVPEEPAQMAEESRLPYSSLWELVAEMFHADVDFLKELNPDLQPEELKPGDEVTVPNVAEPFDLRELNRELASELEGDSQVRNASAVPGEDLIEDARIVVDKVQKSLTLYSGDKVVAHAPITPGAENNPAPTGDWILRGISWMPDFRWDESMLDHGVRSEDAHILPPGPNSPVGVIWMATDKSGIGLHGTAHPDSIGRSTSHGCIRMSNWDAWSIGRRVKAGISVKITGGE